MNITIIGTGYVGLVTGACFSEMGNNVFCVDNDVEKINSIQNNKIPIYEQGLNNIIKEAIENNCISFTTNLKEAIKKSDLIFITVGTPMKKNGSTNLKYINDVSSSIGEYINIYKIIITKSTIPVGTTKNVEKIIKDKINERKKNIDFDIANNPEFLKEGKAVNDFKSPDRIIIGLDNNKIKKVFEKLYKPFSLNHKKLIFMDIASSELTKYAANAMLATKISFINEMSIIAEKVGADINLVRTGIGSDPRIGYSFIYPSIGYGGSCFPKDTKAIINFSNKLGYKPQIISSVNKVNENQKKYFLNKIFKRFSNKSLKGLKFAIWGLSYKPGTNDMRESASIFIINEILKLGGEVKVFDPKAMKNAKENYLANNLQVEYCKNKYEALENASALILITEWPEFRSPDFNIVKSKLKNAIIFDGRNQFDKKLLKEFNIEYHQIG